MAVLFLAWYQAFILRRLIADNICPAIIGKNTASPHAEVKRPLFKCFGLGRLRCLPCLLTRPRVERWPEWGEAEVRVR